MFGPRYRDELDEPTAREFDALFAKFKAFLLAEHNEDGTHNFDPDGGINESIQQIIDGYQAHGQWWKHGPWRLNDPDVGGELSRRAVIRPPDPAAGTYHDYDPYGIDDAIGVSIEPTGDITITGIKNKDIAYERLLFIRNRDSGNSITLPHEDTGSLEAYRFDLPNDEDIVLGPHQNVWLLYDSDRERWTVFITGQTEGGIGAADTSSSGSGESAFKVVSRDITELEWESMNTSPVSLVSPAAGKMLVPASVTIRTVLTSAYTNDPVISLRYSGVVGNISDTTQFALNGAAPTTSWARMSVADTVNFLSSPEQAIVLFANADMTGTGSLTAKVRLGYYEIDAW